MVLPHFFQGFELHIRSPYHKGNLNLLARSHGHGNPVHVQVVLSQGLPVVGDKEDAAAAAGKAPDKLDGPMDEPVRVHNAVVVGVEQFLPAHLAHLYRRVDGRKHLKFRRIIAKVRRPVIGVGMNDHKHLVRRAGGNVLPQAFPKDAVVAVIGLGETGLQVSFAVVFFRFHRGLSPVAGAPAHVHTRAEQVVGQNLVQLPCLLRFQDGFDAGTGVGGGGIGHKGRHAVPHGVRVGFLGVAVQRKMVPAGAFPDDEHTNIARVGDARHIRQQDLFLLRPVPGLLVADAVHNIGPGGNERTQFRGIAVYPGPVFHIAEDHGHNQAQRYAHMHAQALPGAVIHFSAKHVHHGQDAQEQHIQHKAPAKETGGLRVLRIDGVTHHLVCDKHIVRIHKKQHHSIPKEGEGHDALPHEPAQEHQQIIDKKVDGHQQKSGRYSKQHAIETALHMLRQIAEERQVECTRRIKTQNQAIGRQGGLFMQVYRHNFTNSQRTQAQRTPTRRLNSSVSGTCTGCGALLKGFACTRAS